MLLKVKTIAPENFFLYTLYIYIERKSLVKNYPLREEVFELEAHVRKKFSGLNLKSCELIHKDMSSLLANLNLEMVQAIQFYPYPEEVMMRIADVLKIPVKTMTLSAGSDIMLLTLLESLGTTTGRMILQSPNYFGWHNYAKLQKLKVTEVLFGAQKRHSFCIEQFLTEISAAEPSLVVLSNPNNPTGFAFGANELTLLADACGNHGHILIIDECFSEFNNLNHYEILGPQEHIIFVKSFSKTLGLAGARIALTIASEKITRYLLPWRPESTLSGLSLQLLEALLQHRLEIARICHEITLSREKFVTLMQEIKPKWQSLASSANFVNFFLPNEIKPNEVVKYTGRLGYRIRDVSDLPGLENCVRFGIAEWELMQTLAQSFNFF